MNESKSAAMLRLPAPKHHKRMVIWAVFVPLTLAILWVGCLFARRVWAWLNTTNITGIEILADVNDDDICQIIRGSDNLQLYCEISAEKNAVKYPRIAKHFDEPTAEEIAVAASNLGTMSWTSSDASVLTVDASGVVKTAEGKGDAVISVTLGDGDTAVSDSCKFHVGVPPTEITATERLEFKKYKEQLQIKYAVHPDDADISSLAFRSSDENIATVNTDGLVTAIGAGDCVITITLPGTELTAETSVHVPEPEPVYPLSYHDDSLDIQIYKEKYAGSWVYAAHVTMSDYSRLGTECANGTYGSGTETTSHAASRLGTILTINGDYAAPHLNYPVVRSGVMCNNKGTLWCPAVYSQHSGLLVNAWETGGVPGYAGADMSALVSAGTITDTFSFGPPFLVNGTAMYGGESRAQRTFIGTNGSAGDLWLCVSDGRHNDGVSPGLTPTECAQYLQSKGCVFGVPLDGGGSSTMVFQNRVLNAERGHERAVVDFVYIR